MLFATNLFGVFEIGRPSALAGVGAGALGARRSFFDGLLAVALATPCSAPFLGTAVGFALRERGPRPPAIFLAIGVGLAAPFAPIAAFPVSAKWLPRPGPWMLELKTRSASRCSPSVVWLIWLLGRSAGADAAAGLLALLLAVALVAWGYGRRSPAARAARRAARDGHAALLAGANVIKIDATSPPAAAGPPRPSWRPAARCGGAVPRRGPPRLRVLHRGLVPHLQVQRAERAREARGAGGARARSASRCCARTGRGATSASASSSRASARPGAALRGASPGCETAAGAARAAQHGNASRRARQRSRRLPPRRVTPITRKTRAKPSVLTAARGRKGARMITFRRHSPRILLYAAFCAVGLLAAPRARARSGRRCALVPGQAPRRGRQSRSESTAARSCYSTSGRRGARPASSRCRSSRRCGRSCRATASADRGERGPRARQGQEAARRSVRSDTRRASDPQGALPTRFGLETMPTVVPDRSRRRDPLRAPRLPQGDIEVLRERIDALLAEMQ